MNLHNILGNEFPSLFTGVGTPKTPEPIVPDPVDELPWDGMEEDLQNVRREDWPLQTSETLGGFPLSEDSE